MRYESADACRVKYVYRVLTRQIPGQGNLDANENWRHILGREKKRIRGIQAKRKFLYYFLFWLSQI